ncbi:MAG: hypothetical protein ACXVIG_07065 [Halobacteriota archaeon]
MQAKEKQEAPLKCSILPNESYKWSFILEKQIVENPQHEQDGKGDENYVLEDGVEVLPIKLGSHFVGTSRDGSDEASLINGADVTADAGRGAY